jgi:hypothetical protein
MTCANCGKQTSEDGDAFCGKCGQSLTTSPATLREIVRAELQSELAVKYKDQKLVVIETVESIVERLEKWTKWFLVAIGIPAAILLATLATIGITSYREAIQKIDTTVKTGEQRLIVANKSVDVALRSAESAKQKASDAIKSVREVEAVTESARMAAAKANSISSGLRGQFEQIERDMASLRSAVTTVQKENSFESRVAQAQEVTQATDLNRAIAGAFQNGDLKQVIAFLRAMGSPLDNNPGKDQVEAQVRALGRRVVSDAALRKKYFEEARKAGLIN